MPPQAALLFEDETILRLFPDLRRGWSPKGVQARVGISGRNDRRVLFGCINVQTGHRVLEAYKRMSAANFQDYLGTLRRVYKSRPIWMLLDNASAHTTKTTLRLAHKLNITFVFLPKQCPELNAMDHFWKQLKSKVSSNHQYKDMDQHVAAALNYNSKLTKTSALTSVGIHSENFWLKALVS